MLCNWFFFRLRSIYCTLTDICKIYLLAKTFSQEKKRKCVLSAVSFEKHMETKNKNIRWRCASLRQDNSTLQKKKKKLQQFELQCFLKRMGRFCLIKKSLRVTVKNNTNSNFIQSFFCEYLKQIKMPTITEMCRMRSSSLVESLAGSSVGSGRLRLPSWWWMWKSRVPFSSHCWRQRTRGMSSEFPEISVIKKRQSRKNVS